MRLKAILFDMGGTLDTYRYDRDSALATLPAMRSLLSAAGSMAAGLGDEELLRLVEDGGKSYSRVRETDLVELPPDRVWREFYLREGGLVGLGPEIGESLAYLVDTGFFPRSLRPGAAEALRALKSRGLALGVVSNVLSRGQVPGDLGRYGIRGLFDAVLTSSEFGRRKPDPAIFHRAAEMVGAAPAECAYVGDRVSRDVAGARRAGFALAVRIRHDYVEAGEPEEPAPDLVIDALGELVPAVDRFQTGGSR